MASPKKTISPELLAILACPLDKADLKLNKAKTNLVCTKCRKKYAIKDGVPILLAE